MDDPRRDGILKMKQVKNDQVYKVFTDYIERRNCFDIVPMSVSEEEVKTALLVESEVGRSNSITYTCHSFDPVIIDRSFTKFVLWIKELQKKSKHFKDLDCIVPPLFCHFYMELYQRTQDENETPMNFFRYHLSTVDEFPKDDEITTLMNAIGANSLYSAALKKEFRSNRYFVNLSEHSSKALRKYLSDNSHVILFQIFQTWFHFNIQEPSDREMEDKTEETEDNNIMNGHDEDTSTSMEELLQSISDVRNETPPIYSINLNNIKDDIDCGKINRELGIVVYSYSSGIYISSLVTLLQLDYTKELGDVFICQHSNKVRDFSFMKNNRYLVSASSDRTVKLFDLNTYSLLQTYKGHQYPVYKVATSPNGCFIVSGAYDFSCRLFGINSPQVLRLFAGHTQEITSLDFHPNSMYFASGSADKHIRMWTSENAVPVRLFLGSKGSVHALSFSPDGKYLASAGEDEKVRVWDLTAGQQLTEIEAGNEPITKLAWSANSTLICSGSIGGIVKTWDFNAAVNNSEQVEAVQVVEFGNKLLDVEFSFDTFSALTADPVTPSYVNSVEYC